MVVFYCSNLPINHQQVQFSFMEITLIGYLLSYQLKFLVFFCRADIQPLKFNESALAAIPGTQALSAHLHQSENASETKHFQ